MNTDQHLDPESAAAHLGARLAKAGVNKTITPRLLEAWRHKAKGPAFAKALGRVWYAPAALDAFASGLLKAQLPGEVPCERLLPGPTLAQQLTPAEAGRVWWLLMAKRPPHAGQVDGAIARAAHSLINLVEKSARDAVTATAIERAAAARGSIERIQPADLVFELKQIGEEFDGQLTQLAVDRCSEAITLDQLQNLRRALGQAVSARLDQLMAEYQGALSKRDALSRTGKAGAQDATLVAVGIPKERLAAVREAIGGPPNVAAVIEQLSDRIADLGPRVERLKSFSLFAAPGDYTLLDGEGFDDLIVAERAALGLAA